MMSKLNDLSATIVTNIRCAAEPEDIAGLGLFLASELANIITGAIYSLDDTSTAH